MPDLRPVRSLLLSLTVALAGCGEGPPNLDTRGVKATHGGALLELPDKAGFVELTFESDAAVVKSKTEGKVVAYFLGNDEKPLTPAPTDVLYLDEKSSPYPMTAAGGGRFETEPIKRVEGTEVVGTVKANVGGKPVEVVSRAR